MSRTALTLVAVALLAAGCGGDDDRTRADGTDRHAVPTATWTGPIASTPAAPAPPPAATEPLPGDAPTAPEGDGARPAPGGDGGARREPPAGGEEPVRVPAAFVAHGMTLTPPRVTVPPFLAIELSVASADGRPHVVEVDAPRAPRLAVPAGRRAALRVPGLRAGEYAVRLDGELAAALVVGGEVGP